MELFGFNRDKRTVSVATSQWYNILEAGSPLALPWEDGAEWDWMMNYITNNPFPEPPDSTIVGSLFCNGSYIEESLS